MELSNLVSAQSEAVANPASRPLLSARTSPDHPTQYYPSPVKEEQSPNAGQYKPSIMPPSAHMSGAAGVFLEPNGNGISPRASAMSPKQVAFELLFPESPQYRARLPLRVSIFPHDTTDSIVTTVKNFYGLYSGPTVSKGVSFEDEQGNTLIARYENFRNNMVVYVRVIEEAPPAAGAMGAHLYHSPTAGIQPYQNGEGYPPQAPQQFAQHISRPTSRTSRKRSPSPNAGRGRRSTSAGTNPNSKPSRSRSSKNRGAAHPTNGEALGDTLNGYSSGDGGPGSASGKIKDQLGNTEISVDNIVEGGRRKRAKFESSELPLFAPPQMPAATSNPSVSPARRIEHPRHSLPFVQPGQNPFTNPRPMQSPQSYGNGFGLYSTPATDGRRHRGSIGYPSGMGILPGMGMMPTPDPTVGSTMSEEDKDVAMQLMRLGEMSNVSHGRTSASTLDDTFSGKADAASSTGATSDSESDSEDEMPPARRQKLDSTGNHKKIYPTTEGQFLIPHTSVEASGDDADSEDGAEEGTMAAPKPKKLKANTLVDQKQKALSLINKIKVPKVNKPIPKVKKAASVSGPMSPASLPTSRKPSVVSNPVFPAVPGEDDQPDLSSKPRCQRCRKSKKGCDRQRPCGRCRDAGIPAEFCISEDEGNGRKGRYGRHMGVPISKEELLVLAPPALLPAAPIAAALTDAASLLDKNKKRKR